MFEIGKEGPEEELEERVELEVREEDEPEDGPEDGQEDGQEDIAPQADTEVADGPYVKTGPWYKEWTTERMSSIIRREAIKAMDAKLGTSSWRNIIEAIGKRFLTRPFEFDQDEEWTDEASEWWEMMFGHSAGIGEDMYGRLLTEAPGARESERAKNRYISRQWHQFLQFPSVGPGSSKAPPSFYNEATRAMQIQRHRYLREVNIQRELERYVKEGAQFRDEQQRAIQAVMNGSSPIFVVMATSAGKSMIFMLPAFCGQGGTTIVIVPLTSLQSDLKRRCDESGISCSIWCSGRAIQPAAIVLVTPESALTKGFRNYMNLLRATHKLDRIVFEECHTIMASRPSFRPQMRQLGELVRLGVQVVFITATLRPRDEDRFFQTMNIIGGGVRKIRGSTSRRNIQYQIRRYPRPRAEGGPKQDGGIQAAKEFVQEMKIKYPAPAKIIIYSSQKRQADKLGEELGCMVYHADVGSRKEKDGRLAKWMQGDEDHRVVIATNALGLGIDVGDTRVVGHIGMPKDLADYIQESGRAGRDGEPSESVVLLPADVPREEPGRKRRCIVVGGLTEQHPMAGEATAREGVAYRRKAGTSDEREMAAEIQDFIQARCRRVVLDRVMDRRYNREQCEEGEEVCDMCQESQRQNQLRQAQERILSTLEEGSDTASGQDDIEFEEGSDAACGQDDIEFEQQQSQRSWVDFHVREVKQEEAYAVEELERQLRRFQQRCAFCYAQGKTGSGGHRLADCSIGQASQVRVHCREFIKAVRKKKTIEEYSCCLYCYVPQAICQHWKAKGEGGRWEKDPTKDCQFKGVIIEGFWSMVFIWGERGVREWLEEWSRQDGYDIDNDEGRLRWLGKKVEWGGIEVNKLVQAFSLMARDIEELEDI